MPFLLLWHPQVEAVAPPAYAPTAAAARVVVTLRAPATGQRVRDVSEHGDIDISFDAFGPTSAGLTLRRGTDDVSAGTIMPGGDGALVEIDARSLGVPDVWLGQIETIDEGITHAAAEGALDVSAGGPFVWLDDIGIADVPARLAPAGTIVQDIVGLHAGAHRLTVGRVHTGAPIDYSAAGQSIGGMLKDLSGLTFERPSLVAIPGACRFTLDWLDPLAVPDARRVVTLQPGRNCSEVKLTSKVRRAAAEVVAVGRAYVQGPGAASVVARAPAGAVVGRRAALTMSAYTGAADQLSGGPVTIRQDLASGPAILAEAAAQLRRTVPIVPGGSATITDSALFPAMRPGAVMSAVFADALGLWGRCEVQLRTTTWTLARDGVHKLTASFDLWSAS